MAKPIGPTELVCPVCSAQEGEPHDFEFCGLGAGPVISKEAATAREELEAAREAELAEVRWHERADHYGARFEEEKARADRLEAALEEIAERLPMGAFGTPIDRAQHIAREALIEHGPDDGEHGWFETVPVPEPDDGVGGDEHES